MFPDQWTDKGKQLYYHVATGKMFDKILISSQDKIPFNKLGAEREFSQLNKEHLYKM